MILGNAEARRLALRRRASEVLDPKAWVPGAGQGTLLLVARADDRDAAAACAPVDDAMARAAWIAEAAVVSAQGVPEDAPIGVMALPHGRWIRVWGMAASEDGTRVVRGDVTGNADDPGSAGRALAELLLARGVAAVLRKAGPVSVTAPEDKILARAALLARYGPPRDQTDRLHERLLRRAPPRARGLPRRGRATSGTCSSWG